MYSICPGLVGLRRVGKALFATAEIGGLHDAHGLPGCFGLQLREPRRLPAASLPTYLGSRQRPAGEGGFGRK